ncbi:MAG: GNAT family N-acetyltransferase [Gemmatimonadaceae bacterium]
MTSAHNIAARAVVVRPATTEDLPTLGTLGASLMAMHHELDGARFIAPTAHTEARYAAFLGSQLTNPDVVMLVAETGGEVVGYVYAGIEGLDYMALRGPAGVGYDLIVDPVHRGLGVGRSLLDATLVAFRSRGATQIVLSAAEGNVAAQRLFATVGFRRTMVEMTKDNFGGCK